MRHCTVCKRPTDDAYEMTRLPDDRWKCLVCLEEMRAHNREQAPVPVIEWAAQ